MTLEIPIIEAEEMHGSARLAEKQTSSENKAQRKRKAMKSRSDDKIPNIIAVDNGTMVESFKFLNYYQLATSSLVSKRYGNLIRTHRHKLALLDVCSIGVINSDANEGSAVIKMFNKELSPEEYNKLIVHNGYSKEIPLDGQITCKESAENDRDFYVFGAYQNSSTVFFARAELKDETWPIFQHFIRLLTDPFIYIRSLTLYSPNVLSFLAGAMNPDRYRLQCESLSIHFNDDTQKFVVWIKDHVRCDTFDIYVASDSNYDEELLDLFLTGSPCTSAIDITNYDLSKVIVDLAQKFMGLENRGEYQIVESIWGYVTDRKVVEELKRDYAEFIAEEEQFEEDFGTRQVIGFINNDIQKKLTISDNNFSCAIKITNF